MDVAFAAGFWTKAPCATPSVASNPIVSPAAATTATSRRFISNLPLNSLLRCVLRGAPSKMSIQELFRELDALELHQVSILFYTAVERHADFPRPCKRLRILNHGFIIERVGT